MQLHFHKVLHQFLQHHGTIVNTFLYKSGPPAMLPRLHVRETKPGA